jgi:hypothetical protein
VVSAPDLSGCKARRRNWQPSSAATKASVRSRSKSIFRHFSPNPFFSHVAGKHLLRYLHKCVGGPYRSSSSAMAVEGYGEEREVMNAVEIARSHTSKTLSGVNFEQSNHLAKVRLSSLYRCRIKLNTKGCSLDAVKSHNLCLHTTGRHRYQQ